MILLIVLSNFAVFSPKASATGAQIAYFNDLSKYDFASTASSLTVSGTVTLYDGLNCNSATEHAKSFSNTSVPDLGQYPRGSGSTTWNDAKQSLSISGSVTIYQDSNYGGKTISFTSNNIAPYNYGTSWSQNPSLVESQGEWDATCYDWKTSLLHTVSPDSNNFMNWTSDGHVSGQCTDNDNYYWKTETFSQGFERAYRSVSSLGAYPIGLGTWNDRVVSLQVTGTVTLYWDDNFVGSELTFTNKQVPNLANYVDPVSGKNWADEASSLNMTGVVTLYDGANYIGNNLSFNCYASYQPPLLNAGSGNIMLDGIVDGWGTSLTAPVSTIFTGAKFDVWAVQNQGTGNKLMLELYFLRGGADLDWSAPSWLGGGGNNTDFFRQTSPGGDTYNYLSAIDAKPQWVNRIAYSGDLEEWQINITAFLVAACAEWPTVFSLNNLYIDKVEFTLEAGDILPIASYNWVQCNLDRLVLEYNNTIPPPPAPSMYLTGPFGSSSQTFCTNTTGVGSTFTVTAWINTVYDEAGWVGALTFNSSQLNVVSVTLAANDSSQSYWTYNQGIYAPYTGYQPFMDIVTQPTFDNSKGSIAEPSGFGEVVGGTTNLTAAVAELFIITFEIVAAPSPVPGNYLTSEVSWDPNVASIVNPLGLKDNNASFGNFTYTLANPSIGVPAPSMYLVNSALTNSQTFYTSTTSVGTLFNVTGWINTATTSAGWSAALTFNASQLQVVECVYSGTAGNESQWMQDSGIPKAGLVQEQPFWNNTAGTIGEPTGFGETAYSPYQTTNNVGSLFTIEFNITQAPPAYGSLSSTAQWDPSISYGFDIYGIQERGFSYSNFTYAFNSSIQPFHDVAVTDVSSYKTVVGQNLCMNITVTTADLGNYPETYNLTVFANTTIAASQSVTLSAQTFATVTFVWNVTAFAKGNYLISAYTWPVQADANTTNDLCTGGWVTVSIPCDITGVYFVPDGRVDMRDIALIARAFGSFGPNYFYSGSPPSANWNANADFNNDGRIDMKDIALIARNFGQHYP